MRSAAVRAFVITLLLAMLASACAQSPGTSAGAAKQSATSGSESPEEVPQLRLVAVGDSIAAGGRCDCLAYPGAFGKLLGEVLSQPVRTQNLAVNGASSDDLLHDIRISQPIQSAVRAADVITITIGINDINVCGGESDAACYEAGIAAVGSNLDAVLTEIDELQADHPHMLRATGYYNFNIGKPGDEYGPSFQAFYAEQLAALNSAICAAVVAHQGLCVELLTAFNGPTGDQDAAAVLVDDHEHPSAEGHEIIAEEIAAAGYAPLRP
jgi:lysophospholipase L1-like esterase